MASSTDEEPIYIVDQVLAERSDTGKDPKNLGGKEYLIKWQDYPEEDNLWIPDTWLTEGKKETLEAWGKAQENIKQGYADPFDVEAWQKRMDAREAMRSKQTASSPARKSRSPKGKGTSLFVEPEGEESDDSEPLVSTKRKTPFLLSDNEESHDDNERSERAKQPVTVEQHARKRSKVAHTKVVQQSQNEPIPPITIPSRTKKVPLRNIFTDKEPEAPARKPRNLERINPSHAWNLMKKNRDGKAPDAKDLVLQEPSAMGRRETYPQRPTPTFSTTKNDPPPIATTTEEPPQGPEIPAYLATAHTVPLKCIYYHTEGRICPEGEGKCRFMHVPDDMPVATSELHQQSRDPGRLPKFQIPTIVCGHHYDKRSFDGCFRGDQCHFAHWKPVTDYKYHDRPLTTCKFWLQGRCNRAQGECLHDHIIDEEFQMVRSKAYDLTCPFWLNGRCKKIDAQCLYIHALRPQVASSRHRGPPSDIDAALLQSLGRFDLLPLLEQHQTPANLQPIPEQLTGNGPSFHPPGPSVLARRFSVQAHEVSFSEPDRSPSTHQPSEQVAPQVAAMLNVHADRLSFLVPEPAIVDDKQFEPVASPSPPLRTWLPDQYPLPNAKPAIFESPKVDSPLDQSKPLEQAAPSSFMATSLNAPLFEGPPSTYLVEMFQKTLGVDKDMFFTWNLRKAPLGRHVFLMYGLKQRAEAELLCRYFRENDCQVSIGHGKSAWLQFSKSSKNEGVIICSPAFRQFKDVPNLKDQLLYKYNFYEFDYDLSDNRMKFKQLFPNGTMVFLTDQQLMQCPAKSIEVIKSVKEKNKGKKPGEESWRIFARPNLGEFLHGLIAEQSGDDHSPYLLWDEIMRLMPNDREANAPNFNDNVIQEPYWCVDHDEEFKKDPKAATEELLSAFDMSFRVYKDKCRRWVVVHPDPDACAKWAKMYKNFSFMSADTYKVKFTKN